MPERMDPMRRDAILRGMPELPLLAYHNLYRRAEASNDLQLRLAVDTIGTYIAELRHDIGKMLEHRTVGGWPPPETTETWENVTTVPPTSREACTHGEAADTSTPCRACQAAAKEEPL